MATPSISLTKIERILPRKTQSVEQLRALSLVDATTANFALTNAIWLYEPVSASEVSTPSIVEHLRKSLKATLDAYPQWCGRLKSVQTTDGTLEKNASHLPRHARRFGRLYVQWGTQQDPGVEFIEAQSVTTLDTLCPAARSRDTPIWNCDENSLNGFIPCTDIGTPLESRVEDENSAPKPLLAVQITSLACGGLVIAAKSSHPMADISSLVYFVKDWASINRADLQGSPESQLKPRFEPEALDAFAAGDINADEPNTELVNLARNLPMHRYDWWTPAPGCPFSLRVPSIFSGESLEPAGSAMPWSEWDVTSPVSYYTIHLTHDQVELLWKQASGDGLTAISRHDAVVAHIWSCITQARNLQEDSGLVHCDLVIGLRTAFKLDSSFIGSPVIMTNVKMTGNEVSGTIQAAEQGTRPKLHAVAERIRETINQVNQPAHLSAHLHTIAYEKSPQRIWQAFLGQRHILVTSWARAGLYDVDFGFSSRVRFADGVVPEMDGNIVIKEAPPTEVEAINGKTGSWTKNGVDISVHIRTEDMLRLIEDPLLLPSC